MSELENALKRLNKALELVRALTVIEGTDRDDIERLLENAIGNLLNVRKSL